MEKEDIIDKYWDKLNDLQRLRIAVYNLNNTITCLFSILVILIVIFIVLSSLPEEVGYFDKMIILMITFFFSGLFLRRKNNNELIEKGLIKMVEDNK